MDDKAEVTRKDNEAFAAALRESDADIEREHLARTTNPDQPTRADNEITVLLTEWLIKHDCLDEDDDATLQAFGGYSDSLITGHRQSGQDAVTQADHNLRNALEKHAVGMNGTRVAIKDSALPILARHRQSSQDELREALEPVLHWYQSDEQHERPLTDIVRDIVADLQNARRAVLQYARLKRAADALSLNAQTSGGTAGRDDALVRSVDDYSSEAARIAALLKGPTT